MAKQVEDVVTDDRVESLKTVKFGGYDKASVDYYIDELKEKHSPAMPKMRYAFSSPKSTPSGYCSMTTPDFLTVDFFSLVPCGMATPMPM